MKKKFRSFASAVKVAFPHTLPIMAGFWFLGMTYGIYMKVNGFSFVYPMLMSLTVFGGSLEFVAVTMLLSKFAPWQTLLTALIIQSRHIFYGIAMLEKYKGTGFKKTYLIFGLCDETFSINSSVTVPNNVDKGQFFFAVTLLNHFYWVVGATLGGVFGELFTLPTEGLDFVMTAMFTVIFLEQWLKERNHTASAVGVLSSGLCLALFGADSFLLPTLACVFTLLIFFKTSLEKEKLL